MIGSRISITSFDGQSIMQAAITFVFIFTPSFIQCKSMRWIHNADKVSASSVVTPLSYALFL